MPVVQPGFPLPSAASVEHRRARYKTDPLPIVALSTRQMRELQRSRCPEASVTARSIRAIFAGTFEAVASGGTTASSMGVDGGPPRRRILPFAGKNGLRALPGRSDAASPLACEPVTVVQLSSIDGLVGRGCSDDGGILAGGGDGRGWVAATRGQACASVCRLVLRYTCNLLRSCDALRLASHPDFSPDAQRACVLPAAGVHRVGRQGLCRECGDGRRDVAASPNRSASWHRPRAGRRWPSGAARHRCRCPSQTQHIGRDRIRAPRFDRKDRCAGDARWCSDSGRGEARRTALRLLRADTDTSPG